MSYWLISSTRLSAGISYFVAANQPDFMRFGAMLEFMLNDSYDPNRSNFSPRSSWGDAYEDDESSRPNQVLHRLDSFDDDDQSVSSILPAWDQVIRTFDESNVASVDASGDSSSDLSVQLSDRLAQEDNRFPRMLTWKNAFAFANDEVAPNTAAGANVWSTEAFDDTPSRH